MKGISGFLARLYPAKWRARYGEEFEALLEDSAAGWSAIFDLLKGALTMQLSRPAFPKLALLLTITGVMTGLAVSFVFAPVYVSEVELQFVAPDAHRNLTEYLTRVEQQVLSRSSLADIIEDPRLDLYRKERARTPLEDVIDQMRGRDIEIMPAASGSASGTYLPFTIRFSYPDREKARQTVQCLISKFQDANLFSQRYQAALKREGNSNQISRMDQFTPIISGINLEVLDPPSLPVNTARPNRFALMFFGLQAGFISAVLIAIRRRLPRMPVPARLA